MARNFWRRSVPLARPSRLALETLESREVPAIIQNGLPSWLSAGPAVLQNNQSTNIVGTYADPAAGPVTGVAPDPTNADVLYVATGGGGIWRTTNATAADPVYTPLTDNLPSLSVTTISLNPANPKQLVAGLGRLSVFPNNGTQTSDLVGLLYTENASDPTPTFRVLGANTSLGANNNMAGLTMTKVVVRDGYILATGYDFDGASANDGTYLSRDNGFTFIHLDGTGGLPAQAGGGVLSYDLAADPGSPNRVYLVGQTGLYRTDNVLGVGGQPPTWVPLASPLFTINGTTLNSRLAIHNSPAGNVVYLTTAAQTVRNIELNGVFFSTDQGANWTEMDLPVQVGPLRSVTGASNAAPIVISSGGHGLQTGDRVQVSGVTGNLAANGVWTVTVVDGNNFSLDGSVATGVYTGGGSFQLIYGVNSSGQNLGQAYQAVVADPVNPNLLYISGTIGRGGVAAAIVRGDRGVARGFNAIAPPAQWSPIVGNGALGTSPAGYSYGMAFDRAGTLYEADESGLYRRGAPATDLSAWTSANGNIDATHFSAVAYDANSNVVVGGTYGTGAVEQTSGVGVTGSPVYDTLGIGDYGAVATDNTSVPGATVRYTSDGTAGLFDRRVFNSKDAQVGATTRVRFAAPTDPTRFSGLDNNQFTPSRFGTKFVLNAVDPRLATLSILNKLYEDNDPSGNAGDVVAKVTPAGLTGAISALSYGGRQNGLDLTRIAYVGTTTGQLFIRGAAGGFNSVTVPGAGVIRSIAVDPDNWRDAYVLQGSTELLDPAQFLPSKVFHTTDAGATWIDVTQNLFTKSVDNSGNPVGGLSADIRSLALWDAAPGDAVGGNTVLLAAGAGGVYRFVPAIVDPASGTGGWTEFGAGLPNAVVSTISVYGNRLIAGTLGRGVWEIPDISPTIRQAAVVTVQGTDGDDNFTFGGSGGSSGTVFVSDGQGNSLFVSRNTGASFSFVGGKGADTLTVGTSGQPGGDLQFLTGRVVADMGNDPGDTIVVSDDGRAIPTAVTVTAGTVGAGASDNLFAPGAVLAYSGLARGTLRIDLGTQQTAGTNAVFVQSTSAGTTQLVGTNSADDFVLNSTAGAAGTGDLAGISGTVSVDGRGGANTLTVSDFAATSGNANANIIGTQILGFAGPTDAAIVTYGNVGVLTVLGSNSPTLAESFRVENPAAPLTVADNAGPDFINVRAANKQVKLNGGPGSVVFRVTSTAGDTLDGDLLGIVAPVTINAGAGSNQLIVSNYGNPVGSQYTVGITPSGVNSIAGATPQPITFTAAGRFAGPDGNGIWLRGSNAGNDTFNLGVTPGSGSQTAIDGNGGNDVFTVTADALGAGGAVTLRAGGGSNSVTVDSGVFGVTSDSLAVVGGGTTRLTVLGFTTSDKVTPAVTLTDTVNGTLTGVGNAIRFTSLSFLDYDGRGGRNNFAYRDGTNSSFGSLANPGAGIVYQPKGAASGEIRLAGVGPVVNFVNINGTDAAGLTIDGDANRTGARDTLTVVGVSDTALGVTGALAGSTAGNGADTFDVSDQAVVISNESLGQLRTVAPVPSTIRTLIVQGGNEATQGDTFNVTPSSSLDILVDGQGPTRKRNGNSFKVNTAEATHLERSNNAFFGTPQTRIVTASGAAVAFKNFPNAAGVRSIFAVGADAGGGPRVRVYDAVTKEVLFDRFVYDPGFTGGVRVATGDVTGDGVPDLIVAAGIGGGPHIQVFDGVTFQPVASFFAYEATFTGGTFVAVGDLNGDGVGDIVVGSGNGGGPVVKVFDGTGRALTAFFAYDKGFRGGVRVAAGDVNGDGKDDIVTGAGPGGGPHVRVFNASDLRILTQYMAFDPSYAGGVYVTAGDVNGDGTADVVVGPGTDALPQISIRDSRSGSVTPLSIFDIGVVANPDPLPATDSNVLSANGSAELGGLRVAVADLNASGIKQIVVSRGPGNVSRVRTYTVNPLAEAGNFLAFEPDFTGGVYVG